MLRYYVLLLNFRLRNRTKAVSTLLSIAVLCGMWDR